MESRFSDLLQTAPGLPACGAGLCGRSAPAGSPWRGGLSHHQGTPFPPLYRLSSEHPLRRVVAVLVRRRRPRSVLPSGRFFQEADHILCTVLDCPYVKQSVYSRSCGWTQGQDLPRVNAPPAPPWLVNFTVITPQLGHKVYFHNSSCRPVPSPDRAWGGLSLSPSSSPQPRGRSPAHPGPSCPLPTTPALLLPGSGPGMPSRRRRLTGR